MPTLPDSGFHTIAPVYDQLARLVFGHSLERSQAALLPFVPPKGRVLLIGGGSGWLLEQLLRTGKKLDILYLDAAPAMVVLARKQYTRLRQAHGCTVTFRVGTEQALLPTEQFEAVITPFLLDLFPEPRLRQLMGRLTEALAPQGVWLFADFWPQRQPSPRWQKALLRLMYLFFGTVSRVEARQLPDYAANFAALGYQEVYSHAFFRQMIQAKVYQRTPIPIV